MFNYENYLPKNYSKKDFNRYIKFIEERKNRDFLTEDFTEKHHIIPQCYLPKDWSSTKKFENNKIILSPREHFIAHRILWKALGGKMANAFYRMTLSNQNGSKHQLSSRQYQKLREEVSLFISKNIKGRIWIHSDTLKERRLVRPKELMDFLNLGWDLGKDLEKMVWITNDKEEKYIEKEGSEKYLSEGWKIGLSLYHRKTISKNKKGKSHTVSNETKEKMSKAHKGLIHIYNPTTEEAKKVSFEEYKKSYESIGWKRGLSETVCKKLSVPYSEERKKKHSEAMKGIRKGYKNFHKLNGTITSKLVDSEEKLEEILSEGWILGTGTGRSYKRKKVYTLEERKNMSIRNSEINKGRKAIYREDVTKYVHKDKLEEFLRDGWELGTSKKFKESRRN